MKTKKVKKLWKGTLVSVRDYEIKSAIEAGGMRIEFNDEVMELTVDQLKILKPNGQSHMSKFKGQYQLVDITWKPLTHDPRQETMNV